MRASDTVLHVPTGETWVLCGVDKAQVRVVLCGYPFPSIGYVNDCKMIEPRIEDCQPQEYKDALLKYDLLSFIEED